MPTFKAGPAILLALVVAACSDDSSPAPQTPLGDVTPPVVAIVAPDPGTVTGIVTLLAEATDSGGIAVVDWKVNGGILGAPDSSPPYQYTWNTASFGPGIFSWTAVARDSAGNTTESAGVTYTVAP